MSSLAFVLILLSGFMHALYNVLIKQSCNKTVFIWWMFFISTALLTITLPLLPGTLSRPSFTACFLGFAGAFCFVLYHLFTGHAYQSGDLSVTYPLSQTGMLYMPLWGVWFLGEELSLTGVSGIMIVAAGAYLLQLRRLSLVELLRPFGNLVDQSVLAALAAGFAYSLGSVIDKTGVDYYSPLHFTYLLVASMLALMTANILRPCHRGKVAAEWRENRRFILAGSPLMMGSFLSFRYGLAISPMSYAVTVRQVSILVGVLVGVFFLGESCGRIRLFSALMILSGVFLIRFG